MSDVILHAFNWSYREIASRAAAMADAGYGAVLFPPPLYSDPANPAWWQRYQPKDYRILRSWLGNKADLVEALAALHQHGLKAYADIVFNHMANEKRQRRDPYNFPGAAELAAYRVERESFQADRLYGNLDDGLFSTFDFHPEGDIQNWNDLEDVNESWLSGLPDLECNAWVIAQQRLCLAALNALGFDGYRVDAIKHLPEEHIRQVFEGPELAGKYVFGEALTSNDHEENLFLWPLLQQTTIAYYDFPLHETLRRVFSPPGSLRELVDPAAFAQALPGERAITFSVTHDIPYNGGFRGQLFNPVDESLVNVYLFGRRDGAPLVFSDHNESAAEYTEDRDRWAGAWERGDTRAMLAFRNAVGDLPQSSLVEADGFLVFARGEKGIVALNKTEIWQHPVIDTSLIPPGEFRCLLHGHRMQISGDHFGFAIPPRQAQLWLRQME